MKRILTIMLVLLTSGIAYAETYTVEKVIDAETLKLTNGEEVRLIGIKAPEDEKMGKEATEFVESLGIEGKEVFLEFDVQERDKYGRLLAYVWYNTKDALKRDSDLVGFENLHDGFLFWPHPFEVHIKHPGTFPTFNESVFLNASIINTGYATLFVPSEVEEMTIPPNVKYADLFKELYEDAREQGRGLWVKKEIIVRDKAIHIAREYATQQGRDLTEYQEPKVDFDKEKNIWRVNFEKIPPSPPGGYFSVYVDGLNGEAIRLMQGE